jgi:KDO2-lipid IV(A) lauroyltransferase
VAAAYAAGWGLIKALPERVTAPAFRLGANLAFRRQGRGVRRLSGNLGRVAPDLSERELADLTRRALHSYARYWLETFRLPVMDHAAVAARVRIVGEENLKEAVAAGRGVIVALPHTGNWDVAGIWMVQNDHAFSTVAERLRPEAVFNRFVAYRESLGMEVFALDRGQNAPAEHLAKRLRAGGIICLVADRDLTASGVEVDFFGGTAKMPAGPAFLAATTGATLLPIATYNEGPGWVLQFHPPLPVDGAERLRDRVRIATQQLADIFAADIARYPHDWHMLQRMWIADTTG